MMRYQIRALGKIFQKPRVLYSTSVSSKKEELDEGRKSAFIRQISEEFSVSKGMISNLKKDSEINTNFSTWKSHISAMEVHGFSHGQCFSIIYKYPALLEIPLSEFENTIMTWYQAMSDTDIFKSLLLRQPLLLEIDADVIRTRVPQLRLHFSCKSLAHVLINCPNIMFDHWKAVLEKIDYLLKERRFKIEDLLQGDVLSNSLDFIKFRLELLEKCGIYKQNNIPVHKVNKYDKSRHKNPPLKDMLHKSTKDFVKVAKISEEEYLVYEDMFTTGDEDYDDDDDDDTDTDEE